MIIKVNLCYYWQPATGYTTDPRVVSGIIDYVRDTFGRDVPIQVAEADATAMRTNHAFLMLNYQKLAQEKKVELLNLSTDSLESKKVRVNGHDLMFEVPVSLLNTSLFINVPKLKTMRATYITCAMKNIFGCIGTPKKIKYHPVLNEAIVGTNKILKPHVSIVDGTTALGSHPIKLNLIMAGSNPFSLDWIASKIMGYNPYDLGFLKLAIKEKLGDPNDITVVGEELHSFKKEFPHQSRMSLKLWTLQLKLLRIYQRISGDVIPPILEQDV
ncbi:MAG TPA: DUF362 domain-containing protein [Candidatus Bathyarchaeia archaeon]|nr:DUF362 domain-containing protein [Candidatus Bathyarchaeia archaeon]